MRCRYNVSSVYNNNVNCIYNYDYSSKYTNVYVNKCFYLSFVSDIIVLAKGTQIGGHILTTRGSKISHD